MSIPKYEMGYILFLFLVLFKTCGKFSVHPKVFCRHAVIKIKRAPAHPELVKGFNTTRRNVTNLKDICTHQIRLLAPKQTKSRREAMRYHSSTSWVGRKIKKIKKPRFDCPEIWHWGSKASGLQKYCQIRLLCELTGKQTSTEVECTNNIRCKILSYWWNKTVNICLLKFKARNRIKRDIHNDQSKILKWGSTSLPTCEKGALEMKGDYHLCHRELNTYAALPSLIGHCAAQLWVCSLVFLKRVIYAYNYFVVNIRLSHR